MHFSSCITLKKPLIAMGDSRRKDREASISRSSFERVKRLVFHEQTSQSLHAEVNCTAEKTLKRVTIASNLTHRRVIVVLVGLLKGMALCKLEFLARKVGWRTIPTLILVKALKRVTIALVRCPLLQAKQMRPVCTPSLS